MATIGSFEAKTHFSELLDRVRKGETITITRHGVPAAKLIPVGDAGKTLTHHEIIEGMRSLRKRTRPAKAGVRTLIKEGRRF